eukprot:scaffold244809_cov18-Tisochrysis_lutea.AAC.1
MPPCVHKSPLQQNPGWTKGRLTNAALLADMSNPGYLRLNSGQALLPAEFIGAFGGGAPPPLVNRATGPRRPLSVACLIY